MGTWNVAGIAADAVDILIAQLSDNYTWDIMLLQEGFRQTDGIATEFGHLVFASGHLVGNLRCPAIFVHERWRDVVDISFAGSGEMGCHQFCITVFVCLSSFATSAKQHH